MKNLIIIFSLALGMNHLFAGEKLCKSASYLYLNWAINTYKKSPSTQAMYKDCLTALKASNSCSIQELENTFARADDLRGLTFAKQCQILVDIFKRNL